MKITAVLVALSFFQPLVGAFVQAPKALTTVKASPAEDALNVWASDYSVLDRPMTYGYNRYRVNDWDRHGTGSY